MPASEAGIASAALVWLGRDEIATLEDAGDAAARLLKSRYPDMRDAVLRSYPWNFAMTFARLPGSALDAPLFGFSHKCDLPAGGGTLPYCLRLWRVDTGGSYSVRGRSLYTARTPPVSISYVRRETNPELFDSLFAELLAVELAVALQNRLANDDVRKRARELLAERRRLRRAATVGDATEASPDQDAMPPGSWARARRPM